LQPCHKSVTESGYFDFVRIEEAFVTLVLFRTAIFLALTFREVAGLMLSRICGRTCRKAALHRAHRWGRNLRKILGLSIETLGEPPPVPAIIVANHRSYTDIPALLSLWPCFFLAKTEVSAWPLIGTAAKNGNAIFVKREDRESRRCAKEEISRIVASGFSVTVFCEGTTSPGPYLLPFRPGVFYLAARDGLPVIPVALQYVSREDAWIDDDSLVRHFFDRFRRRETRLTIAVGPVFRGTDGGALKRQAEDWISGQLNQLNRRHQQQEGGEPWLENIGTVTSSCVVQPVS
jgi:1-acyl-sn-glycerol-3-phosphate acyltransferase